MVIFLCACTNYARTGEWKLRFSIIWATWYA